MGNSLRVAYFPEQQTERLREDGNVLAILHFSQASNTVSRDAGEVGLSLRELGDHQAIEVWHSSTPVKVFRSNGISCCSNGEFLFAALQLEEPPGLSFELLSRRAYEQIFNLLDDLGGYRLLRVWNYFPRINEHDQALERYQSFCVGRYQAFEAHASVPYTAPAATAIGTGGEGLIVYFLASQESGVPIENPRQVSAYHYPGVYSPRPPLFSRAVWHGGERGGQLFVSGTASVTGHETRYRGDTLSQLNEAMRNLQALLGVAGRAGVRDLRDFSLLKVYLRDEADFPLVSARMAEVAGDVPCLFLQADICRSDLPIEVDALYSGAPL